MLKIKFKEEFEKICARPILATFLVFLYATFLVVLFTVMKYGYKNFLHDLLVEAHGMLFDILIIGTFIFALQRIGEKRIEGERNIQRHQDEVDDFRNWKSGEAAYRIAGNIKRLNRYGITKINLYDCYLKKVHLNDAKLQEADLTRANLEGAYLQEADLEGANLRGANLEGANLEGANLQNANLFTANLQNANLFAANLQNTNLQAKLQGANFLVADLQGADLFAANPDIVSLSQANLQKAFLGVASIEAANLDKEANLQGADLRDARNLTVEQLSKVKTLYQAKLDPDFEKEIKEKYPHLLEKP